ncbi:MAG: hypothetical protein A3B96_00220 [Candidatus Spechtbacteria bacterium RIFCSPHIGHO2_02_FULL_43_15b]|uniref:Uncharacterized protein n=1 Tax=Candidatus Spechtbacteria bacterium RIFCSPHIGHO2_01_FULL_43_30 TaxID=1802158 RepID=A0A1G2H7F0_9BACT|nr:MAG: hypothetical protein A2827_02555 [Candidatus Spechtbacteria bacterium RIFCSPHIGHO2_01_FULL_43_30]OGZ58707.1 MAG: hypothetical protein A3B96_00220 [Candidatus Spechtbacteria bacterium RIFCSPHIGHO2_02_FULL_43_15b]
MIKWAFCGKIPAYSRIQGKVAIKNQFLIFMDKYTFKCTCGDVMSVEADSRENAVMKMKEMMNADAIAAHMQEKHAGDPVPSVEETHAMIEQNLQKEE